MRAWVGKVISTGSGTITLIGQGGPTSTGSSLGIAIGSFEAAKVSRVQSAGGAINITGTSLNQGLGFPSPSLVTVLRRTTHGGQVAINVDLNRALRDPLLGNHLVHVVPDRHVELGLSPGTPNDVRVGHEIAERACGCIDHILGAELHRFDHLALATECRGREVLALVAA